MTDRWQKLQEDIAEFTDRTFGDSNPRAKALHLMREAQEAADDPSDIVEWADCMILLLDGACKAGFDTSDLYDAVLRKMEINKTRKWGKPDADGVTRHID